MRWPIASATGSPTSRCCAVRSPIARGVPRRPGAVSNERLEFLGDAVLGWAIADMVYHRYDVAEGQLTDLRKSVVNAIALAEVAQELDLGPHILLGRGEAAAGGSDKPSILSDAFEAVLGAVYLDGGAEAAYGMVERLVVPRMPETADAHGPVRPEDPAPGAELPGPDVALRCTR